LLIIDIRRSRFAEIVCGSLLILCSSNDRNLHMRQELDAICRLSKGSGKMKAVAMILVILLTMPVSYAMLDEAMKKIRIRNKMKPQ
jgi:hypothetical protein